MSFKKTIKHTLRTAVRNVATTRFYRTKIRRIDRKLEYLKKHGRFRTFPDSDVRPTVYDYPFFRKADKKYLDFFYSASSSADPDYIPLTTYFVCIEPLLNQIHNLSNIVDKNFYDLHFQNIKTPVTYLRKMNSDYFDGQYRRIDFRRKTISELLKDATCVILKPSVESGAGKSIEQFVRDSDLFMAGDKTLDEEFLKQYPDFVLQECVIQHPFFRKFNPDSNNTLRVLTYRSVYDGQVHVLHRLLRVGKKGNFLDHDNFGGIAIGISSQARLNAFGFDSAGNRLTSFNEIGLETQDTVPFLEETETIAKDIAKNVFYGRLLAFDFTVDESGTPLLIEINCRRNGVSQYQMNNGALFKEFTREVLDFCVGKSYAYHFTI